VLFHGVLTTGTLHFCAPLALKTLASQGSTLGSGSRLWSRECTCIDYIGIRQCHVLLTEVEESRVATTFCCRLYTLYLVGYIS
jgi:hypothetical protein